MKEVDEEEAREDESSEHICCIRLKVILRPRAVII